MNFEFEFSRGFINCILVLVTACVKATEKLLHLSVNWFSISLRFDDNGNVSKHQRNYDAPIRIHLVRSLNPSYPPSYLGILHGLWITNKIRHYSECGCLIFWCRIYQNYPCSLLVSHTKYTPRRTELTPRWRSWCDGFIISTYLIMETNSLPHHEYFCSIFQHSLYARWSNLMVHVTGVAIIPNKNRINVILT